MTINSLVPPQTPENINPLVVSYLEAEFAKLNSKNTLDIECLHGGKPWVENIDHWNYEAAKKATEVCNIFYLFLYNVNAFILVWLSRLCTRRRLTSHARAGPFR